MVGRRPPCLLRAETADEVGLADGNRASAGELIITRGNESDSRPNPLAVITYVLTGGDQLVQMFDAEPDVLAIVVQRTLRCRTLRCRTASATQRAGTLRYVAASSIVNSGRC
jgi:hypothetical protein